MDLVRGEASESDEESVGLNTVQKVLASEVSGEDSESDEEKDYEIFENNASELTPDKTPRTESHYNNNLLQQKLIETNIVIWKNLTVNIKELATSSSKELLNLEQLLMKLQVSMQNVLSSLKLNRGNVKQLHEKTNDILSTNFIPNISI